MIGFITKYEKKTSHTLFGPFRKKILQNIISRESFIKFKN